MHSQPPKSPNPPSPPYQGGNRYQGDFANFTKVGVIGKCPLISLIHHNSPVVRSPGQGYGGETRCLAYGDGCRLRHTEYAYTIPGRRNLLRFCGESALYPSQRGNPIYPVSRRYYLHRCDQQLGMGSRLPTSVAQIQTPHRHDG